MARLRAGRVITVQTMKAMTRPTIDARTPLFTGKGPMGKMVPSGGFLRMIYVKAVMTTAKTGSKGEVNFWAALNDLHAFLPSLPSLRSFVLLCPLTSSTVSCSIISLCSLPKTTLGHARHMLANVHRDPSKAR